MGGNGYIYGADNTYGEDDEVIDAVEEYEDTSTEEDIPEDAKFDLSQHMILSYLMENKNLWLKCSTIIKDSHFDEEFRSTIKFITDFFQKYKKLPTRFVIHSETGIKLAKPEDANDEKMVSYISDTVEEFCRHREFEMHLIDSFDIISKDKSRSTMNSLIEKGKSIANISLNRDLGYEVHDSSKEILEKAKKKDGIDTGMKHVNIALGGGMVRPSANLISAASGDGKSIFLQNMAYNLVQRGENVIFYTLELEKETIQKRFAAMMTNTHMGRVYSLIDEVDFKMKNLKKTEGLLWVKKFPMTNTTMADIDAHYHELTEMTGVKWGAVCLDYLDLVTPIREFPQGNIHIRDKFSAEEFSSFIHENDLIGWSASQQVKGAADEKEARSSGVAGGVDRINIMDVVLVGKRTEEDQEDERIWYTFVKARNSAGKLIKVPIRWNRDTQRYSDWEDDLFYEANPVLSGRKSRNGNGKSRVSKDPIAKELGNNASSDKKVSKDGKAREASAIIDRLTDRFGSK